MTGELSHQSKAQAQVDDEHREDGPYTDWEAVIREAVMEGGPAHYGTFSVGATSTRSAVEELTSG
jgi:hypothetical protein